MDAVHRGDSDIFTVGKSVILPSSHTGGPRYRAQNYQDAMAIYRSVGYPDLFITFTCNPKWPEINDMLGLIGQKDDRNRVDIMCRVFEIKLQQLMHYIKKEQPFGEIMACLYTIEFQKRDLPHAHILLFLHPSRKNPSPEYIDSIISAELPDINVDPDAYNAVKKSMLHGPCGQANTSSPCMLQERCNKFFPKNFNETTTIGEDGYPIYRRRNTGITIEKKGTLLDNRFVIPYNRNLLVKFESHINVELCNSTRSIKYLFKYINEGPDRATAVIETTNKRDEIRAYLDCSMPGIEKTKFTEWLETNKQNEDARTLTYAEFPKHWVWNSKGSTSFECIRTVNGVTYTTFKAACYALGLLDDDREWVDCLSEAAVWATELWKTHSQILSEDMLHIQRKRFQFPTLRLTTAQTEAYALVEIESLMQKLGKSLKDIDGMPQPDSSLTRDIENRLLNEELNYDRAALKILLEKYLHALNHFQRIAYDAIVHSVQRDEGKLFFISGLGGTGKTFLWNTITLKLRSDSMIVLLVATSGIASLLLPNGRTAYSRFRIPLDVAAESTCEIKHGQEMIKIPPELYRPTGENPMEDIVNEVYPSLLENYRDPAYLQERAILTPKNETVHELNDFLMSMIPGEARTYLSSDSVCKASINTDNDDLLYPAEFLNSLRRQLPVAPCFAMTINKSQGQSLKRVGLYLPCQVFTHGQVYVALSRVTELQGLVIVNADSEVDDKTLIKNIVYKEVFNNIQDRTHDEGKWINSFRLQVFIHKSCISKKFMAGLPGRSLAKNQTIWLCNARYADSNVFSRTLLAKSASVQSVVCFPYSGGVVELGTTDLHNNHLLETQEDNGNEWKLKRPEAKIDENHVLGSRGKKKRKDTGVEEKESFWNQ
ncbi:hypothetical protein AgCh_035870 [Apium graveolens]